MVTSLSGLNNEQNSEKTGGPLHGAGRMTLSMT
jgi:hypothetical protein